MKKNFCFLLLLWLCCSLALVAQNTYQKKVVSYVNTVVAVQQNDLSQHHQNFILKQLEKSVQMERFSYAELPKTVIQKFSQSTENMTNVSAETVRPLIEKTLTSDLLKILDANKEMLSKQNISEAERNSFLATKAQAAGLSATQLEGILNSGFFYVPYVEYYRRSTSRGERDVKNDKGKVIGQQKFTTFTHELKLGLLWYQMKVDRSNNPTIAFIGAAKGWNDDAIERSGSQDDGTVTQADWNAFAEAVNVSAVNINTETKKLEEFKLTGGVAEVTTFGITLNLGTREGVGLDDSYWVEEMVENAAGDVVKERRGFVKVRTVGNNKSDASAMSYAQVITGTNYSQGLSVTEIPLLGANGVVGFGKLPLLISKFDNKFTKFGLSKYNFGISVNSEVTSTYGPMASVQIDLAKNSQISELWLQLGGAIGFLDVDGKFYLPEMNSFNNPTGNIDSTNSIGLSLTYYGNLGLIKKFYFRRFGLILQADTKLSFTEFSATGKDGSGEDLDYSMLNLAFGFDGRAGMEIYLTPTLSIGGGVEYTASPMTNEWSVKVTDKDKNETKNDKAIGPDVKYSGLGWFAWINYSLPSLK